MTADRANLIGLSRAELTVRLATLGEPAFRARQVWHWLYCRGARDFSEMTTLSKALREKLAMSAAIVRPEIVTEQRSTDQTRKWLLRFADGKEAETVYIPEADRGALCISSQVGCTLTCAFCHTG
ncbi:MAG TPA: 23S rRNA (adenine(2503)-C(2))-methyltransferase RlmN, partial [Candidatus Defluviicoccus seviourii]|nr:23S rRNA (adenine(2503)-C(2))-methyltransferase RlmN [Candidatus Defluviicoccus seviourii]